MINDRISFESGISPDQDLEFKYLKSVIEKRNPKLLDSLFVNRGLIDAKGRYTNLALLLSDQCTHTTKVAVFKGNTKNHLKGRKEIKGSVVRQIVESCRMIRGFNKEIDIFTGRGAVRRKNFPEAAVEEAVTNALVHRDYSFSGSTIINIFDNRLEVLSVGGIAPELSPEAIKMGISYSRNEGLSRILADLKLMLNLGTGFSKIKAEYKDQDTAPELISAVGAFKVILPNTNHALEIDEKDKVRSSSSESEDDPALQEEKFRKALEEAIAERKASEETSYDSQEETDQQARSDIGDHIPTFDEALVQYRLKAKNSSGGVLGDLRPAGAENRSERTKRIGEDQADGSFEAEGADEEMCSDEMPVHEDLYSEAADEDRSVYTQVTDNAHVIEQGGVSITVTEHETVCITDESESEPVPVYVNAPEAASTVVIRPVNNEYNSAVRENIQYEKVVRYIEEHGSIKRKETQELLGVGQSRALAVLAGMQEEGIIKLYGVGRTSEYRLIC